MLSALHMSPHYLSALTGSHSHSQRHSHSHSHSQPQPALPGAARAASSPPLSSPSPPSPSSCQDDLGASVNNLRDTTVSQSVTTISQSVTTISQSVTTISQSVSRPHINRSQSEKASPKSKCKAPFHSGLALYYLSTYSVIS